MRIFGFDWDAVNIAKLSHHDLIPEDVELLFEEGEPVVFRHPKKRDRWLALGFAPEDRFVVASFEADSETRWARVVSPPSNQPKTIGGERMRRAKGSNRKAVSGDEKVIETEWAGVDLDALAPENIDIDPALIEAIRSRYRLKQITLRIGEEQIAEARRIAAKTGEKYQVILRQWLAQGASLARGRRFHGSATARGRSGARTPKHVAR